MRIFSLIGKATDVAEMALDTALINAERGCEALSDETKMLSLKHKASIVQRYKEHQQEMASLGITDLEAEITAFRNA